MVKCHTTGKKRIDEEPLESLLNLSASASVNTQRVSQLRIKPKEVIQKVDNFGLQAIFNPKDIGSIEQLGREASKVLCDYIKYSKVTSNGIRNTIEAVREFDMPPEAADKLFKAEQKLREQDKRVEEWEQLLHSLPERLKPEELKKKK